MFRTLKTLTKFLLVNSQNPNEILKLYSIYIFDPKIQHLFLTSFAVATSGEPPTPTPWPHQFHSILYQNYSGSLSIIDLWYDWPNGRNFNIIQHQLGKLLYDLEWTNGTSFYYTLDSNKECRTIQQEVGILRPKWLDGAIYLGQEYVAGFLCNVWKKVEFIWYYEDVVTKRPVHWVFYTGRSIHVMTFEVGAVLEDPNWQAPVYCFDKKDATADIESNSKLDVSHLEPRLKSLLREPMML